MYGAGSRSVLVFWGLILGLVNFNPMAQAQDFAKFSRCNEATKQLAQAGDALNRSTRERLLYDLYIDLMPLF